MSIYKFRKLKELYEPYNKMYRDRVSTWEDKGIDTIYISLIILLFPELRYGTTESLKVLCTGSHEITVLSEDIKDIHNGWFCKSESAINKRVLKMFLEKIEYVV